VEATLKPKQLLKQMCSPRWYLCFPIRRKIFARRHAGCFQTSLLEGIIHFLRPFTPKRFHVILAYSAQQLCLLASTPSLIAKVLSQMSPSAEWDVRKEATWVVSNIATGGTRQHIMQLVEHGAIKSICDLLDVGEVRILLVAMEALEAILKQSSEVSNYAQLVDEAEGIDKLESLQDHENNEVYQKVITYFVRKTNLKYKFRVN